jgi:hypothetical protein
MLANGLSNAMLPEFSTRSRMKGRFTRIRLSRKTDAFAFSFQYGDDAIHKVDLSQGFHSGVCPKCRRIPDLPAPYNPRLVFPRDIVIGRKKTRITLLRH